MRMLKKYVKKMQAIGICCMTIAGLAGMITLPVSGKEPNPEYYQVVAGKDVIAVYQTETEAAQTITQARAKASENTDQMFLSDLQCSIDQTQDVTEEELSSDSDRDVDKLSKLFKENAVSQENGIAAYTMKINDFIITVDSKDSVIAALNTIKDKYDSQKEYHCELVANQDSQENVMTASIVKNVSDAATSIQSIKFEQEIDIVPSYVQKDEIKSVSDAVLELTKEEEKNKTHIVGPDDCLSLIAQENGMTVNQLMTLNQLSDSEMIIDGDELIITVPEPILTVLTETEAKYTEEYQADVEYKDNDSWYTTKQEVKSEGTTGIREVTAKVVSRNGVEQNREILQESLIQEAQPKVIERGTQVPPTYIKPLTGGSFSSPFGARWGRMHKGVDWSCSVGTTVKASCGGTVASAGWVNGYGNCILISHSDGKQTRYGHLSQILVSAGQKVAQGDKIALSGNTGNSTGPHLHFEILVNGTQVDPMPYLN